MGSHRKKSTELDGVPGTISAHYLSGDPIPVFVGFLRGDIVMPCIEQQTGRPKIANDQLEYKGNIVNLFETHCKSI